MARASLKITKSKTTYRTKTKYKIPKTSTSSSSGKKKGNPRHCPVCGKFI